MGDRLREYLGIKRLDPEIAREINDTNARIGVPTALLTAIAVVAFVAMRAAGLIDLPTTADAQRATTGHLICYGCVLAGSAVLFACSLLHVRGRVRSHWSMRISFFVYDLTAIGMGIYLSVLDYGQGHVLLSFSTMVVLCSCLFVVIPVVTVCVNSVAFIVLYALIDSITGTGPAIAFNLLVFWLVVVVVSAVRFNDERTMVASQIEVTHRSLHDALTGLKNRRSLSQDMDRVHNDDVTLAMLDVDDFKFFNDAYGHGVGDSALRQFADALSSVFPPECCYRSGGDEFLVLVREPSEEHLRESFGRLRKALGEITFGNQDLQVSSSIGAVMGHARDAGDARDMLRIADMAMYEAKRQGKDRAVIRRYDPASPEAVREQTPRALALKVEETDPLTGLLNYMHFRSRATRQLKNPSGLRGGPAFVYFDIANFNDFNHRYGYEGGDLYLQAIASMLRDVFKGQLIARFGEDHFVVLADRERVVERVMDAHERAHSYQRDVILELKAGICYAEPGQTDISALYDHAKLACDSIKTDFERTWRAYDSELSAQVARRSYIMNSLSEAIQKGWVQVYYQPVVRTQTGRLCGVEALARWIDPKLGMISPAEFVDVLEQFHLIDRLDLHILDLICRDYHLVVEQGLPPVPVSFNLSRLDFELCDVFQKVEDAVARWNMPKSMLHVEVTESAFVDNAGIVRDQIARFREAGYQVWMDDFGSGYSTLNLLETCEFDVLKIDMLFLKGLDEHEGSRVIISSIVDMAKQLGIETLTEGVETQGQLEFLQEIGCEKLQGYLFSKPRPLPELTQMFRSGSMQVELMEERPYYTKTGRVNIIGRSPSRDDEAMTTGMAPLAVVERRRGVFHYLSANASYRELIRRLGIGSLSHAEARFTDDTNPQMRTFATVCSRAKREGGVCSFDHISYGVHCNTRVSYVATDADGTDAYLICTISDADLTPTAEESTLKSTMRFIYSIYSRVDLIAEDNGLMENVYLNSGQYRGKFVRNDARTSLAQFAKHNVHPDDRAEFLEYYDMDTVRERLRRLRTSHLSAFFRTISPEGGYERQLYMLIPMERDGKRYWLSCVRDVIPSVTRFMPEAGGITYEAMLWESIVARDNAYIFWKDKDLRFVGANGAFRRFYGLDSSSDFVGKSDAEMGWNIFESDMAQDERHVLETGEPVRDARISCLAKGRLRDLMVDKVPVYRGSRRVGLVGVFRPADEGAAQPTGELSFASATNRYVSAYQSEGADFRLTSVEVTRAEDAGGALGDVRLQRLVRRLMHEAGRLTGNQGMVAQSGRGRFAIVRQVRNGEPQDGRAAEYRRALGEVRTVDGIPCSFELRDGSALFSEAGSLEALLELVKERMR